MKRIIATGIATLILSAVSLYAVAQTRVTGHIFAEIVELTGAESKATDYVELQGDAATAEFDLGEFSFRGKANVAYDLMVTSSNLVGNDGFETPFQALPGHFQSSMDETGNQVVRLTGSAGDDLFSASDRQYAGNYQVVFAYN